MLRILILAVFATGLFHLSAAQQVPNEWIVVVDDNANGADIANVLGLKTKHVYGKSFKGFAGHIPPGLLKKVRNHPGVSAVLPNNIIVLAPPPGKGKDKDNTDPDPDPEPAGQVTPTGYSRIGAGQATLPDLSGMQVAIIDTGIQLDHPDLHVNQDIGYDYFAGSTAAARETPGADGHGHGTHVSGTVGAIDNDIDVIGIAPGVELIAVRVLNDSGSGTSAGVAAGVDWVAAQGIPVANMSLGGSHDAAIDLAVQGAVAAGVTMVVAAGNEDTNIDPGTSGPFVFYGLSPASVPEAITVSALADYDGASGGLKDPNKRTQRSLGSDDEIAVFSNYGTLVDVAAPGVLILSTWTSSGTNSISGTSMATPHVTGLAALILAANPGCRPADVAAILNATGTSDYNDTKSDGVQEPLINVPAALAFDVSTIHNN